LRFFLHPLDTAIFTRSVNAHHFMGGFWS
jgi:hypothetical protein